MTSVIFPKQTSMCLPGTLRVSYGIENQKTDVNHLLQTIEKINKKPRSFINTLLARTHNGTLFLPKTKTEEKIKRFVERIVENVYSIISI